MLVLKPPCLAIFLELAGEHELIYINFSVGTLALQAREACIRPIGYGEDQ